MSFSLDLSKATAGIKVNKDKVVRGTLLAVASRIIKRTPVGNPSLWISKPPAGYVGGSLRGAWNASIGSIDESRSKGPDSNGGSTISDASKAINSYKSGQIFYFANPLPYAMRVEMGWSSQQPQGMLRRSLVEAQTAFDEAGR